MNRDSLETINFTCDNVLIQITVDAFFPNLLLYANIVGSITKNARLFTDSAMVISRANLPDLSIHKSISGSGNTNDNVTPATTVTRKVTAVRKLLLSRR